MDDTRITEYIKNLYIACISWSYLSQYVSTKIAFHYTFVEFSLLIRLLLSVLLSSERRLSSYWFINVGNIFTPMCHHYKNVTILRRCAVDQFKSSNLNRCTSGECLLLTASVIGYSKQAYEPRSLNCVARMACQSATHRLSCLLTCKVRLSNRCVNLYSKLAQSRWYFSA